MELPSVKNVVTGHEKMPPVNLPGRVSEFQYPSKFQYIYDINFCNVQEIHVVL